MYYFCLFLMFLIPNLSVAEPITPVNPPIEQSTQTAAKNGLRMGFNHGKFALSVRFPGDFPLKFANIQEGKQIYYVNAIANEGKAITYQFSCHGHGLDGLAAFKDEYLKTIKASFLEKNPDAQCNIVLDEEKPEGGTRIIIDHAGDTGNRSLFVGDFRLIEGKIYLISELIEVAANEKRDAYYLFDETFLNSFDSHQN